MIFQANFQVFSLQLKLLSTFSELKSVTRAALEQKFTFSLKTPSKSFFSSPFQHLQRMLNCTKQEAKISQEAKILRPLLSSRFHTILTGFLLKITKFHDFSGGTVVSSKSRGNPAQSGDTKLTGVHIHQNAKIHFEFFVQFHQKKKRNQYVSSFLTFISVNTNSCKHVVYLKYYSQIVEVRKHHASKFRHCKQSCSSKKN